MHRVHHFLGRMGTGDREHLRMAGQDDAFPVRIMSGAKATGDDDAAVFRQGFADGIQRFLHR